MSHSTTKVYAAKQNHIYKNDFQAAMHSRTRVEESPCTVEPTAGYIVAWQYPVAVGQLVLDMNGRVNDIVPTMRFDHSNAHTTLTVYQKQKQETFKADEQTLHALAVTVESLDWQLLQAVRIDFREWLFNWEAVIAAGQPNDPFWKAGKALQEAGQHHDLNLRMPWGAHMTVARFLSASTSVKDLKKLLSQTTPLGLCRPQAVVTGHYTCGPTDFHLHPHAIREV